MEKIRIEISKNEYVTFENNYNSLNISEYYNYEDSDKINNRFKKFNINYNEIDYINYKNYDNTTKGKREKFGKFLVIAILVILVGISLEIAFDTAIPLIVCTILGLILFFIGMIKKPNIINSDFLFSISNNYKILYEKKMKIDEGNLNFIIEMIRDHQLTYCKDENKDISNIQIENE